MAGIIFQDTPKTPKNPCHFDSVVYIWEMLCRPLSLHEANALLPLIQDKMEELHLIFEEAQATRKDVLQFLAEDRGQVDPDEEVILTDEELEKEILEESMGDFERLIQDKALEMQRYGAFVREIFPGVVDFYSVRAGQPVRLSWHLGETEVSHWQPIGETDLDSVFRISDQDFFGRKILQ